MLYKFYLWILHKEIRVVFMDDILIYSKSLEEHQHHLHPVFQVLLDHKLFVKYSKCSFSKQRLHYLGDVISAKEVATDPAKSAVMLAWPTPSNVTELRGFLGITGYYKKFVQHYGILEKPLTSIYNRNILVGPQQLNKHLIN
uniref:Reverse transcriptase domain-containing protein n=1 Tax=Arundo donax TaxID=35708 RepID=A0A0A9A0W7_ARUDO